MKLIHLQAAPDTKSKYYKMIIGLHKLSETSLYSCRIWRLSRAKNLYRLSSLLMRLYTRRTELSCRSPRTSRELERTPRELASGSPTPTLRRPRTSANVRRRTPNVHRSTAEFARVRPYFAANWRTVRQKIRSREEIPTTSDERYVRRELSSPMANCSSPKSMFWME